MDIFLVIICFIWALLMCVITINPIWDAANRICEAIKGKKNDRQRERIKTQHNEPQAKEMHNHAIRNK
jgi:hypothetical protein